MTEHTGRSIAAAWTKIGGDGAVEKVGDVWNEAAGSDAVKAVGDVLDVAKVKLSSGLPTAGGADQARPLISHDRNTPVYLGAAKGAFSMSDRRTLFRG